MEPEYDFSKGERGKFFRPGADLRLPVYLDPDIQMVNGLLKQEIQIIESVK